MWGGSVADVSVESGFDIVEEEGGVRSYRTEGRKAQPRKLKSSLVAPRPPPPPSVDIERMVN